MVSEQSAFGSVRAKDAYAVLKDLLCRLRESDPSRFAVRLRKSLDLFLDGNQDGAWPLDHLIHLLCWVIELPESSSKKKQYFPSNEIAPSILAENPNMWLSRVELRKMGETIKRTVKERTEDRLFYEIAKKLTTVPASFDDFDCVYVEWQKEQRANEQAGEPSLFVDSDEDFIPSIEDQTNEPQLVGHVRNKDSHAQLRTPSRGLSRTRSDASASVARKLPEVSQEKQGASATKQPRETVQVRQERAQAHEPFINVMNPSTPKRKRRRRDDDTDADDEDEDEDLEKEELSRKMRPFPSMFKPMTTSDRNKMQETDIEKLRRKIISLEKDLKMALKFRDRLEHTISAEKEKAEATIRELNSVNDQLLSAKDENARLRRFNARLDAELADYRKQNQKEELDFWSIGF